MIKSNHQRQKFIHHLRNHSPRFWPKLHNRRNHLQAGILVPIIDDMSWTCILTQRSTKLNQHAGEICFPGGKPDPQDKDLVDTALREAKEELGIQKALILGKLSSIPLYTSDFRLEPVVGFIDNSPLHPNPDEVSAILFVDLLRTIDLPKIDGIPTQLNGKKHLSPIFDPKDLIAEPPTTTPIYGGTAYVLLELLTILGEVLQIALPPIVESNRTFPFKTKTPVSN